jgi:hypothetical protein
MILIAVDEKKITIWLALEFAVDECPGIQRLHPSGISTKP